MAKSLTTIRRILGTLRQAALVGAIAGLSACSGVAPNGELLPAEASTESIASPVLGPTLPPGWNKTMLGQVSAKVSAQCDLVTGAFQIDGAGGGLWGQDNAYLVYKSFAGDGEISAHLSSLDGTSDAMHGIMIRSQLNTSSPFAAVTVTPGQGPVYRYRIGGNGVNLVGPFPSVGWVKLVRRGNTVSAFSSEQGYLWTQLGDPVTLSSIGAAASYGIVVASGTVTTARSVVDHVSVVKLPPPYLNRDIGTTGASGDSNYDYPSDGWSVTGSGLGATGTADSLQYAYRLDSGTVTSFTARIDSAGSATSAGIMLRSSLNSSASNAYFYMDSSDNLWFSTRSKSGTATVARVPFTESFSGWVNLFRNGSDVEAYTSMDGVIWKMFRRVTISDLGANTYMGLAVANGTRGFLSNAQFYDVNK